MIKRPFLFPQKITMVLASTLLSFIMAQPPVVAQTTSERTLSALANEPTLQGKVSFKVKRMPLSELLLLIRKGSRVALQADALMKPQSTLVTARAHEMRVSEVMDTLARMYLATWQPRADKGWTLLPATLSADEVEALHKGDLQWYQYRRRTVGGPESRTSIRNAIGDAVIEEAGLPALQTEEGIPLAELSPELQQRIRQDVQQSRSEIILFQIPLAHEKLAIPRVLRLKPNRNGNLEVHVFSPQGERITGFAAQVEAGDFVEQPTPGTPNLPAAEPADADQ